MTVVYDIETLASCFTYSAIDVSNQKKYQFVLHKDRFELEELIQHLKECKGQIGFNNLSFDYPIIHDILTNYLDWLDFTPKEVIDRIYRKAQWVIDAQNKEPKVYTEIRPKQVIIPQLDLFKLWHYDNRARMTSLKALEISMNYPNVMEMEIDHTKEDISLEDIEGILDYNMNDVLATYEFYKKSLDLDKIDLRKKIIKKYGLPCINWNNGKIGENLLLQLFCSKTGQSVWDVKNMRTYREKIALKDCIPDNIVFKSKEFNELLEYFRAKEIRETKGSVNKSIVYKGLKYDYGTGGLHAAIKSGIYESNKEFIIKSLDVASLYPNLPIVYRFFIEHLGPEFLEVYQDEIVGVRLAEKAKPKKEQDKAIVDGFKEAANIPYGKSNDKNSFLYDPLYSMKTTIAGQLVISMICERLCEIPDSQMLMVNTDGCEILIPRKYESQYNDICKQWEKETKLILEFADYNKMIIGDINNYIAVTTEGKIKNKGRFEVDKVIGSEPAYHKDNSFRIVPYALQEYFTKGIPVETTVKNHTDIYDFCGRQKFKRDSSGQTHFIENNKEKIEKQQKNVRYYISNKGSTFVKYYNKGTTEIINKGFLVTIFNKYIEKSISEYDINYQFYIQECYKELNLIENKQLNLF